uniref:PUB domain-containing protein n=1 Tax=Macrostomum lignano TaxID=282301 RepID=A0A1I8FMS9_9PLAT
GQRSLIGYRLKSPASGGCNGASQLSSCTLTSGTVFLSHYDIRRIEGLRPAVNAIVECLMAKGDCSPDVRSSAFETPSRRLVNIQNGSALIARVLMGGFHTAASRRAG